MSKTNVEKMPEGWFTDDGEAVWCTGIRYTETGNNPFRVEAYRFSGGHGPIFSWKYLSPDLVPANEIQICLAVNRLRVFTNSAIADYEGRIKRSRELQSLWEARVPATK